MVLEQQSALITSLQALVDFPPPPSSGHSTAFLLQIIVLRNIYLIDVFSTCNVEGKKWGLRFNI